MTGFRPPIVAGVSGGVGATTLALALYGRDSGTGAGIEADIVVCRSSAESLDRAVRIADLFDPTAVPPVLAVTVDGAERRHPERLDELGPGWAAVVLLPHVARWRGIVDPYREAAGLLGAPRNRLPRALRPYLDAVTRLARAVADSGRLGHPAPNPTIRATTTATRPEQAAIATPPRLEQAAAVPLAPPAPPATTTPPPPEPPAIAPPHRPEAPRPTGEPPFASYRSFVPVGADGPLTSVAVPRPSLVRRGRAAGAPAVDQGLAAAGTHAAPPTAVEPTPASHPDLRPVRGIRILAVGGPLDAGRPE
jgi:hypothetical protein